MVMDKTDLKRRLQSFRYESENGEKDSTLNQMSPIKKQKKSGKKFTEAKYEDLQPSLSPDVKVIFIGFNPGVESSLQQHHYAHFTNLFWKLFNESKLLLSVLSTITPDIKKMTKEDKLLSELIETGNNGDLVTKAQSKHDFDLVAYHIGFTDLILRCTKSASELSTAEKLRNVPRLLRELQSTNAQFIVIVGKGIWEMVTKYMSKMLSLGKINLSKENFEWGLQKPGNDQKYNAILDILEREYRLPPVHVFPNTSGLVASMKYHEKLELWQELSARIASSTKSDHSE